MIAVLHRVLYRRTVQQRFSGAAPGWSVGGADGLTWRGGVRGFHAIELLRRVPVDGQLALQLGDTPTRGGRLGVLAARDTRDPPGVDQVLTTSHMDRLVADAERLGDLLDRTAGLDQVQDLAAELGRMGTSHRTISGY